MNCSREDRLIYRLQGVEVQNISNSESLSILVGNGTSKDNAVEIGNSILERSLFNLNELGKRTMRELMDVPGVGTVTAAIIMATVELGRRLKVVRQKLGLSQTDVAKEINSSQLTISKAERGENILSSSFLAILLFYAQSVNVDLLLRKRFNSTDENLMNKDFSPTPSYGRNSSS